MTKRLPLLLGALIALTSSVAVAQEAGAAKAGVTGNWDLSWETPRGAMTMKAEFKQEGETLTGRLETRGGWQDVKDGKVSGSSFSFVLEMTRGDQTFRQEFKGTLKDDGTIAGTITTPRGESPFTGKRATG
jgi:hypothetical protein